MAMRRVRYVGGHAAVRVTYGDRSVAVKRGEAAEFEAGFADRLLAEPANWQPADSEPEIPSEPEPEPNPAPEKRPAAARKRSG